MHSATTSPVSDAANAAIILVFGLFLFSIQDVIIKHFSGHYSVLQIVFARGLIAICLMLLFMRLSGTSVPLLSRRPGLMLARGLLGFSSYTTFYLAVAAMPLAEVVSITFTMPLIVTAMSALLLGEKVGPRRWGAVVVGFIGVVIILSPSGEFNSLAVVFAMTAAITYASQTIITRIFETSPLRGVANVERTGSKSIDILIDDDGSPVVTDFGLARARPGAKPGVIPPETGEKSVMVSRGEFYLS